MNWNVWDDQQKHLFGIVAEMFVDADAVAVVVMIDDAEEMYFPMDLNIKYQNIADLIMMMYLDIRMKLTSDDAVVVGDDDVGTMIKNQKVKQN